MKNKLVVWGATTQDERVLIALELLPESNKVKLYTFPETVATDDFVQKMMDEWRNDKPVELPEGYTVSERELTVTESLLPDDLKVERGDIIQRAQTEWHFVVLSSKLNEAYHSELEELKAKVAKLQAFDGDLWGSLKAFWDKVQAQVSDKNLLREHADKLRDATNELFGRLKELRAKLDEDFQHRSKENVEKFNAFLEGVENKIVEGLRLQGLFDELKELQRKFRDTEFTRDHRSKVWERLDAAFKMLKDKRSGGSGGGTYGGGNQGGGDDNSPAERLKRRYEGLLGAIEKMDRSIQRDRDELSFQSRKVESSDGQLEMQIRQAKIKMIEERIRSKEEKLNEMASTKADLESRIESQKERDARREERNKLEDAKKAAQEKIAQDIKEATAAREEDAPKLEKAAEALQKPKKAKDAGLLDAIQTTVGEALEDVADTVRAVVEVVSDRIEDAADDVKEKLSDLSKSAQEAVADALSSKDEDNPAEDASPAEPIVAEQEAEVNEADGDSTSEPSAENTEEKA